MNIDYIFDGIKREYRRKQKLNKMLHRKYTARIQERRTHLSRHWYFAVMASMFEVYLKTDLREQREDMIRIAGIMVEIIEWIDSMLLKDVKPCKSKNSLQ